MVFKDILSEIHAFLGSSPDVYRPVEPRAFFRSALAMTREVFLTGRARVRHTPTACTSLLLSDGLNVQFRLALSSALLRIPATEAYHALESQRSFELQRPRTRRS